MAKVYGRFAAVPIGAGKVVRNSGLILTTTAASTLSYSARSDIAQVGGIHGVEFSLWGEDAALQGHFGIVNATAPLNSYIGSTANSLGWKINTGEVWYNGAVIASGLPGVLKGDIIGVRVSMGTPHTFDFYKNGLLVKTVTAAIAGALYFAAGFATTVAEGLFCVVNAGQWVASSDAAVAGWDNDVAENVISLLADYDHLSATTDNPANARYEGVAVDGLTTIAALGFWAWGGDLPMQAGAASCTLVDGALLDALAMQDVRGTPVRVRWADANGTVAGAEQVARYVMDRIEVAADGRKRLLMTDPHDDLDQVASRSVFLPNVPMLAWKAVPLVIGAVASIPALPASVDGTSLFLSARPLASVGAVMDRGDIMEAGTYEMAPDMQQLRMYSPPVGPVVLDGSTIGAGQQPAKLQQFLEALFAGIRKEAWSSADAAAIDVATGYAGVGYFSAGETVRQGLAAILPSYGAWFWQDNAGVLRFARVVNPDTYIGELAFDLSEAEIENLVPLVDAAPGLSRRASFRPNAQVLSPSDLVTDLIDLPQSRRDQLTARHRGQVYSGAPLPRCYRHAESAEPFETCFWNEADAQAEIDRVVGMYAVRRAFYTVELKGFRGRAPTPGQIGKLTYGRFGLQAGKQLLVRMVQANRATGALQLFLWG